MSARLKQYGLTPLQPVRTSSSDRTRPMDSPESATKAFDYIEKDVFLVQVAIDRMSAVAKNRKDMGVYRGRLASKRTLHPVSRLLSSLTGEISANVPQLRVYHLTESLQLLIAKSVGTAFTKSAMETVLRLSMMKSQMLDLVIKKVSELALLHLWIHVDEDAIGRLAGPINILLYFFELVGNEGITDTGESDFQAKFSAQEDVITALKEDLRVKNCENSTLQEEFSKKMKIVTQSYEEKIADLNGLTARLRTEGHRKDIGRKAVATQTETQEEVTTHPQLLTLEAEKKELSLQIVALQAENQSLNSQNSAISKTNQQQIADIQKLTVTLNTLTQDLSSKSESLASLTSDKNAEIASLKDSVSALERQVSDKDFQYKRLLEDLTALEAKRSVQTNSHYELLLSAAKETESFLETQVASWTKKCAELRSEIDSKDSEIDGLVTTKKQFEGELETAKDTILRLHKSLSELVNMDEDTFEAVMKHEMEMMRNAYEAKLKEQKSAYDKLKREKLLETRNLREVLVEKERILDLTSSKLAYMCSHKE